MTSATARQAACANWFEDPTMNVSKENRGARPPTGVSSAGSSTGNTTSSGGGDLEAVGSVTKSTAVPLRLTSPSASSRTAA